MATGRDFYCSNCGAPYSQTVSYPRMCEACGHREYANAVAVAVVMVPIIDGGLVVIKRKKNPGQGMWALPAGFIEIEDCIEAGAREFGEETGIKIDPFYLVPFQPMTYRSIPSGWQVLLFMEYKLPLPAQMVNPGFQTDEVEGVSILIDPQAPLAFPLHEAAVKKFFSR